MINKAVINQAAVQSLHTYFKENEMKEDDKGLLDKDVITNIVKEEVKQAKDKHEALEVLRKNIDVKAEESYKQVFGEDKEVLLAKEKIDTDQMSEELFEEKQRQLAYANSLKKQYIKK